MKTHPTPVWRIDTHEAYDVVCFINAISDQPHYNSYYPGLRDNWRTELGDDGIDLVDQAFQVVSASDFCRLVHYAGARTLNDIVKLLTDPGDFKERIAKAEPGLVPLLEGVANAPAYVRCYERLLEAGVHKVWRNQVAPMISRVGSAMQRLLGGQKRLVQIRQAVAAFLGTNVNAKDYTIYVSHFCAPLAFKLTDDAMVMWEGPFGYAALPETTLPICIHEMLHFFPGSAEAQVEQDRLRAASPSFAAKYRELHEKWHSGPEEFFAVAAEAYLTEMLGLRSAHEANWYVNAQCGGMPLSAAIYHKLRTDRPDTRPGWPGYGPWIAEALGSGDVSLPD